MDVLNNKFFKLFLAAALVISMIGLGSSTLDPEWTVDTLEERESVISVHEEKELIYLHENDEGTLRVKDFDGNLLDDASGRDFEFVQAGSREGYGNTIQVDEENDIVFILGDSFSDDIVAVEINEDGTFGEILFDFCEETSLDCDVGGNEASYQNPSVVVEDEGILLVPQEFSDAETKYFFEYNEDRDGFNKKWESQSSFLGVHGVYSAVNDAVYLTTDEDTLRKIDWQDGTTLESFSFEEGFGNLAHGVTENGLVYLGTPNADFILDSELNFLESKQSGLYQPREVDSWKNDKLLIPDTDPNNPDYLKIIDIGEATFDVRYEFEEFDKPYYVSWGSTQEETFFVNDEGEPNVGKYKVPPEPEVFDLESNSFADLNDDIKLSYLAESGEGDSEYSLIVEKPDSSEVTVDSRIIDEGVSEQVEVSYTTETLGVHNWFVEIDGEQVGDTQSFEVVDYSPPNVDVVRPEMNEVLSQDKTADSLDVWVEAEWSETVINGNVEFLVDKGNNNEWESLGFFTDVGDDWAEVREDFPVDSESRFRASFQDDVETTNDTVTFEVQGVETPVLNNLATNPEVNKWFADGLDLEFDGETGDLNLDRAEVRYCVKSTEITCDDAADLFIILDETETIQASQFDNVNELFDHVETDFLEYNSNWQEEYLELELTIFDEGDVSSNTLSTTQQIPLAEPVITDFTVTSDEVSNLENVQAGDYFDFTLEGEINADDIETITYNLDVSNSPNPDSVTVTGEDFFQDGNIFTNSLQDAFQMQEDWEGGLLEFQATAEDVEGRTVESDTVSVQTGTPPNDFLLNSPEDGEFFLIQEGETEREVTIDYGIDSSDLSGDLELYVDEEMVDTQSVGSNTQESFTYTDSYGEGSYNWYLEWVDETGEVYSSDTRSFEVSPYPIGLSLDSPSEGEEVQILSDPGSVDHDFTVSSDAFTGDWYYEFELTNGDGTVVDEITSTTYSQVEQQFTETVDGVEEGSYTYNVSVYDDSDNSQIITESKSYTTNFDPVFTQEIDSPGDGNTYSVEQGETRNVSYGFSVETFNDATDFTLSLDGNNVRTESVESQTSETFTGDFTDLETGTYDVELSGEDASGRTNTTSASFTVEEAESEDESVDINTIEFTPNLDEARPGDELDVFIEGSGVPENVDFVEIKLEIAGDVETVIVPTDELQEGSWSWAGSTGITVKESWVGATAKITGTVTDIAGRTSQFFRETILGQQIEMFGNLETPSDGDIFKQESGEEVNIPFTGSATAGFDEISYNVEVNDQNLLGGNLQPEESEDFSQFFQVSDWSQDSFGEFNARLILNNDVTGESKAYTNTFEIVEDTGQPVVTISNPRQSQEIEPPRNEDDAEVTLRYRIQTNETGTTSLVLENLDEGRQEINIDNIDSEVSESEAASGEAFRTVDITLDEATYLMRASFEDEQGQEDSRERTFSVTSDPIEPEEDEEVRLAEPAEGEEIPKNVGTNLKWYVVHEQSVGTPTSTFYVEDSTDTVVYSTTNDAPEVGIPNIFTGFLDANLEPGNYQFYADLELEDETLETEKRNLTILDSQPPSTDLRNQDLGVFQQNEEGLANIEAEFTTETFQQDVTIELVTREKGSNDREVVFSAQQNAFREVIHEADWNEFTAGQYEYYVRMESNPTYTSDTGTYTVEEISIDEPLIELDRPEQEETFTYNDTNASVPFRFDAEAYSQGDTNFTLLLETVSEDNSELESIDTFTLTEADGLREYSENFELEESGYRYQVIAEYEDETYSSDTRSFVVDNEETAETPEMPATDERFGILSRISNFGERLLGDNSDFILGFVLLMITSVGVTVRSRSDKIGLATMVGIALGLSYIGVFPSWIAAVFTLISVGISVWTVNLLVGGKGEL